MRLFKFQANCLSSKGRIKLCNLACLFLWGVSLRVGGRNFSGTCLNGKWPRFDTPAELAANAPWAAYFASVYGHDDAPPASAYPLCVGDLWMFYTDLLYYHGVVPTHQVERTLLLVTYGEC